MERILVEWPKCYERPPVEIMVARIPVKGDFLRVTHPAIKESKSLTEVYSVELYDMPGDTLMFEFVGIAAKVVCK